MHSDDILPWFEPKAFRIMVWPSFAVEGRVYCPQGYLSWQETGRMWVLWLSWALATHPRLRDAPWGARSWVKKWGIDLSLLFWFLKIKATMKIIYSGRNWTFLAQWSLRKDDPQALGITQLLAEAISLSLGLSCIALGSLSPLHTKICNDRILLAGEIHSESWWVLCETRWGPFTLLSSRLVRWKLSGLPDNCHKRKAVKECFEHQNGWRWAWWYWFIPCWLLVNALGSINPKAALALPQWHPELMELGISTPISERPADEKQSRWNG